MKQHHTNLTVYSFTGDSLEVALNESRNTTTLPYILKNSLFTNQGLKPIHQVTTEQACGEWVIQVVVHELPPTPALINAFTLAIQNHWEYARIPDISLGHDGIELYCGLMGFTGFHPSYTYDLFSLNLLTGELYVNANDIKEALEYEFPLWDGTYRWDVVNQLFLLYAKKLPVL